jgi:NAD(P)-dependent dehydrogenase (short-subunit alcohol dehydrogenase family)
VRKAKSLFHSANHAINYCARSIAKNAVKEQLRAQGVRVTLVKPADIAAQAKAYLDQHPELYQQALERARRMGWVEQVEPLVTPMEWLTERKS